MPTSHRARKPHQRLNEGRVSGKTDSTLSDLNPTYMSCGLSPALPPWYENPDPVFKVAGHTDLISFTV